MRHASACTVDRIMLGTTVAISQVRKQFRKDIARKSTRPYFWTWDEAQRITEGIRLLLEAERLGHSVVPVYPNFDPNRPIAHAQPGGEPNRGIDHRAASRAATTCQGCRHRRARHDWTHSREIGQCGYPYFELVV